MSFQINTNVNALTAYRNLSNTQSSLSSSLEKLSTGLRINRASDDAAGLTISENLASQVSGLKVAARNAQDGISVTQTAEGGLAQAQALMHRLRDLAVQAGNDSNSDDARTAITTEATSIVAEIKRVGQSTNFNGINLLDGSNTTLNFQVGADANAASTTSSQISVDLSGADLTTSATNLAVGTTLKFDTATNAQASITAIDTEIKNISTARASLGATQNRLSSAVNTLNITSENLAAAGSRVRDTDMAEEMANYTKSNILTQAGVSMLAQATQSSQAVLKLLG
jgi:flagellin